MRPRTPGRIIPTRRASGNASQAQPRRASEDRPQAPEGAGTAIAPLPGSLATDQSREGQAAPPSRWPISPELLAHCEAQLAANLDKLPPRHRAEAMRNLGLEPGAPAATAETAPFVAGLATFPAAGILNSQ